MVIFLNKILNASLKSIYLKIRSFFLPANYFWQKITIKDNQAKDITLKLPHPLKSFYIKMLEGNYEEYILQALKTSSDLTGKTIWDIGAHIGYHTLLFAKAVGPEGHIFAFEPNRTNYKILNENILLNEFSSKITTPLELALSDLKGKTTLEVSRVETKTSNSGGYLSHTTPPLSKEVYADFIKVDVETDTIDNVAKEKKAPDIIKMDVEGAEYLVLSGAINLLETKKPILIIEIHSIEMMFKVNELLHKFNYKTEIIDKGTNTINIIAS